MNMFKRAFIGVLVLALLVSCVAFAAFATDKEYTADNYADILEYYEEPVIIDLSFDNMTADTDYTSSQIQRQFTAKQSAKLVQGEGNDIYLSLINSNVKLTNAANYLNWNVSDEGDAVTDAVEDFLLSTVVSGNSMIKLYVNNEEKTAATNVNATGSEVFSIYFGTPTAEEANVVKYYNGSAMTTLKDAAGNDFAVVPGQKYEIKVAYIASANELSVEVTKVSDASVTAKVEKLPTTFDSVSNIRLGASKNDAAIGWATGTVNNINIHEISAYCGTFFRNPGDRQAETERGILKIAELFADTTIDVKVRLDMATVVGKLIQIHGFTTEDQDVNAAADSVIKGSVILYAEQLENCVAAATDALTYDERVASVEANETYYSVIPVDYADILAPDQQSIDRVTNAMAAFDEEKAALAEYKTNSDAFIAALEGADIESVEYGTIKTYYDAALQYADAIYVKYTGMADALAVYEAYADKIQIFDEKIAPFVSNAKIAADEENAFGVRYEAYVEALAAKITDEEFPGASTFFDAEDVSYGDAETLIAGLYPGVETTLVVEGEDVTYTGINALAALCDAYIANVNSANTALYMKAQIGYLNAATANEEELATFISDYATYPGFQAAQVIYAEIETAIANDIAAAEAYVAAVTELKAIQESATPLEGDALVEKLDEIEVLREAGNILGVEYEDDEGNPVKVDVASANIYVSNLTSALELELGYNEQYVARVASIDFENMTTAELYKAINLAKSAESNEYVSDEYASVAAAMEALEQAIAQYNEIISAVNDAFAEVNGVGADISSLPANDTTDEVCELIKNLFE